MLIGQNDVLTTFTYRIFRFLTDTAEGVLESCAVAGRIRLVERTVDFCGPDTQPIDQPVIHPVGENRALQHKHFLLGFIRVQHVSEILEAGLQAHDAFFTQRVNRRVCHLAEILPEEMTHWAIGV